MKKLWYLLTGWFPRRMPQSEADFLVMRSVLIEIFGVKDEPATWATISGQIGSSAPTTIRKPYNDLANAAKRLRINAIAQSFKMKAVKELEQQLAERALKEAESIKAEEDAKAAAAAEPFYVPESTNPPTAPEVTPEPTVQVAAVQASSS